MTWTVFEYNGDWSGVKEFDDARNVVVPVDSDTAVEWWESENDINPRRLDETGSPVWTVKERDTGDEAAKAVGSVTVENAGAIGKPKKTPKSLAEMRNNSDVLVIQPPQFEERAKEHDIEYERP